ncbi:MAG: hypothetical protein AB3N20_22770 [Rhizobiaceae bacterium]
MLKSIISALVAGEAKQLTHRAKSAAVLYLLAVVALVVGAGFLVGAGYIFAAEKYGSLNAAIGFGIGFAAIAVLLLIINAMQAKAWRRRRAEERGGELKLLAATAAIAVLPGLLKTRSGLVGLLAPIAGLVLLKIIEENQPDDSDDADD